MGGYKADVIGWEQTFNCGDDIGKKKCFCENIPNKCDCKTFLSVVDILELMHRTAFWSKNSNDIGSIYIAASGSGSTAGCNDTDFGKPYSDEVSH